MHTKAPYQGPLATPASSILGFSVAVSPLVHNLWEAVGAKGDSPQPKPQEPQWGWGSWKVVGKTWGCRKHALRGIWRFPGGGSPQTWIMRRLTLGRERQEGGGLRAGYVRAPPVPQQLFSEHLCGGFRPSLLWRSHRLSTGPPRGLSLGLLPSWLPGQAKASNRPSGKEGGYLD